MTNLRKRFRPVTTLGAALALVAVGAVVAVGTATASRAQIHAVAYRLTANLTASQEVPAVQAPTAASGHFQAVLFRSGIGATRLAGLAGCKVIVPPRRSGLPFRMNCAGLVVAVPGAAGQWRLIWQLTYSGLSGPATRVDIHQAAAGHAAPPAFALCQPCHVAVVVSGKSLTHGSMSLAADQATALATNAAYVNVDTAANPGGEIRGQIMRVALGGFVVGR